jgi:hypothetical protein
MDFDQALASLNLDDDDDFDIIEDIDDDINLEDLEMMSRPGSAAEFYSNTAVLT